jgi:hypothetical protein
LREKYGYAPLGAADGPVKSAIFSGNAARLYDVDVAAAVGAISMDQISTVKAAYRELNEGRSNLRYGYVAKA